MREHWSSTALTAMSPMRSAHRSSHNPLGAQLSADALHNILNHCKTEVFQAHVSRCHVVLNVSPWLIVTVLPSGLYGHATQPQWWTLSRPCSGGCCRHPNRNVRNAGAIRTPGSTLRNRPLRRALCRALSSDTAQRAAATRRALHSAAGLCGAPHDCSVCGRDNGGAGAPPAVSP